MWCVRQFEIPDSERMAVMEEEEYRSGHAKPVKPAE